MASKNGAVNWTDNNGGENKGKSNKDMWLRLGQGSNVVRLLTVPHQYHQHKYMVDGGKKYGYRINCSRTDTQTCPVCDTGDKPKRRWLVGVIDRKTGTYKVLDIGFGVFKSIQTLARQDDWGTPDKYDVDIVVDPNGGPSGYYAVVPKPPKPLSVTDLQIQEQNGVEDLERRTAAPETAKVVERLANIQKEIHGEGGGVSNGSSNPQSASTAPVPATGSSTDESDDEDAFFKDYDSGQKATAAARPSPF